MSIRAELPGDAAAIDALITDAFRSAPHAAGHEAEIVRRLRDDGALVLSLVAEDVDGLVGHVAASPVTIDGTAGWIGIGPLAVRPDRQRQGHGSTLMEAVLRILRTGGAAGAVLVGDPQFYGRFGFASRSGLSLAGVPSEYVLALPFGVAVPHGRIAYHAAFDPP